MKIRILGNLYICLKFDSLTVLEEFNEEISCDIKKHDLKNTLHWNVSVFGTSVQLSEPFFR